MADSIKKGYFVLLSKLGLNTLFWIVAAIAAFNLCYSYTLSLEVAVLQERTHILEQKVQVYQNLVAATDSQSDTGLPTTSVIPPASQTR